MAGRDSDDGLNWRMTRFFAPNFKGGGPLQRIGLILRLLRLAAGRSEREMGDLLRLGCGTVESIERGAVVANTQDADRWFEACGSSAELLVGAGQVADLLWPPGQPVLELPQFWGEGVPSAAEFRSARQLIEELRDGRRPVFGPDAPTADPDVWLSRFFAPVDELERSDWWSNTVPDAGDAEIGSWRSDLLVSFNRLLASQAPLGVCFLPPEEAVR